MTDESERRAWVMPAASALYDGINLELLDPNDEDDRHLLLLVEHPELQAAIEGDVQQIELAGQPLSPQLHLTMHEVVANRIWHDDPPEVWLTAQRLTAAGYERHEVQHMLGSVVSAEIYDTLTHTDSFDIARTRRELAALPGSWEALRSPRPMNRADRRAQAKGRRRP